VQRDAERSGGAWDEFHAAVARAQSFDQQIRAIRSARTSVPESQMQLLGFCHLGALDDATVAARAVMDAAIAGCPFCCGVTP
jgi:hypothetical protein